MGIFQCQVVLPEARGDIENLTQLKSSTMWDPKMNGFRSTTFHFFLGGVYCQRERFMGYFRAACSVQT